MAGEGEKAGFCMSEAHTQNTAGHFDTVHNNEATGCQPMCSLNTLAFVAIRWLNWRSPGLRILLTCYIRVIIFT